MKKIEQHVKGWGYELWINNSDGYCGKVLIFNANKKFSWHYHLLKHETFYCIEGEFKLLYGLDDDITSAKSITLEPGDAFSIPPGMRHQLLALEDSKLIEFSTIHFESDTYRIIKGD